LAKEPAGDIFASSQDRDEEAPAAPAVLAKNPSLV
jgi:hypothetical protein